jgi:hypothetical protein
VSDAGAAALDLLASMRRRNRMSEGAVGEIGYKIYLWLLGIGSVLFFGWPVFSEQLADVQPAPGVAWLLAILAAAYGVVRLVSAAGLGPVRFDAAEAEVLFALPVPVRRFVWRRLGFVLLKEAVIAFAAASLWTVAASLALSASPGRAFGWGVTALAPYVLTVTAAAWLMENAPRVQAVVRRTVRWFAWLPAAAVVGLPFVLGDVLATPVDDRILWAGPPGWAAAALGASLRPGVAASTASVASLAALVVAALVVTLAFRSAARPAIATIARRSAAVAVRPAMVALRDAVGIRMVRAQLWAPVVTRRRHRRLSAMRVPYRARALSWKSLRHLARDGSSAWAFALTCLVTAGLVAVAVEPVTAAVIVFVVLYLPMERLLAPLLVDVQASEFVDSLPVRVPGRLAAELSGPAVVLGGCSVVAAAALAATGRLSVVGAVVAAAVGFALSLLALSSAALGVFVRTNPWDLAIPQDFQFAARYPGWLVWGACCAVPVVVGFIARDPRAAVVALVAVTATLAALLPARYARFIESS